MDYRKIGSEIRRRRKRMGLSQCHPAINLRKNSANTAAHLEQPYFQRLNRSECEPVLTRVSVRMSFSIR